MSIETRIKSIIRDIGWDRIETENLSRNDILKIVSKELEIPVDYIKTNVKNYKQIIMETASKLCDDDADDADDDLPLKSLTTKMGRVKLDKKADSLSALFSSTRIDAMDGMDSMYKQRSMRSQNISRLGKKSRTIPVSGWLTGEDIIKLTRKQSHRRK